ncbi:UDP-N-acetylmuramoyl-L-alanyl-D-glutamate--2,6-diaminopimelate ligase [uncultured archaeon]|nr:UDP-N-acetylmuramoyl-L-alanyl-D-glutamate--2,6-diaminopimelate ligase [uncultured archaeon]
MDYEESRRYLERLRYRGGIKLRLDVPRRLLNELGNPQKEYDCVHVAGTNGKGSVCNYLYHILHTAGYRAGLYSKPYLIDFTEEIQTDGHPVPPKFVSSFITTQQHNVRALSSQIRPPTAFEIETALALTYFREKGVQAAVLETGLGGRLDATNVVSPVVSAITPIDFDHMEYLGKTLPAIAKEKAAIIKSRTPAVSAKQRPEALKVLKARAKKINAPLTIVGEDVFFKLKSSTIKGVRFSYDGRIMSFKNVRLGNLGFHQAHNASIALATTECLIDRGYELPKAKILNSLYDAKWSGRLDVVQKSPTVIVDGSHNPQGLTNLMENVRHIFPRRRIILVVGLTASKPLEACIKTLAPYVDVVFATVTKRVAAHSPAEISNEFRKHGIQTYLANDVAAAVSNALKAAGKNDVVLITGSLYMAGDALKRWRKKIIV